MFAKRARSQNFTRDFQLGLGRSAAMVRACNDNQPLRPTSQSRAARRSGLFCRWRQTPAGRLECRWHTEKAAGDLSEDGISLLAHQCAINRRILPFAA
jgi:hypothetical protein